MNIRNKADRRRADLPRPDQEAATRWLPHPAAQIMIWICLAVLVQAMHGLVLMAFGSAVLALAMAVCALRLIRLLRRTRWIFISLLLIYAYATPGTPCLAQLGAFSPGCEGMLEGGMQLMRLLTVLAGLSVLLALLPTAQLIGGLFILAYPLRFLGFSRERLAVRLALTLGYAESAMHDTASDWRASLAGLLLPAQAHGDSIELNLLPFKPGDWGVVVVACLVVLGVVW